MKKIGVALLGLGVVGGGVWEILTSKREMIKKDEGLDIEVVRVLERNMERCKQLGVDETIVTQDIDEIVNDERVNIVAEFFGGVEPAKSFLIKALESGKSIVTANKEMFSKSWHELELAAKKTGAGIYFEASCVGGVPVIRTLTDSMQANKITSLKGIVNGTTNYILTKMSDEGVDYQTCLKEAQRLGYAEADPTADVEGFDAMYKNSILSSLAYRKRVPIDKVYREGISSVAVKDIEFGKQLGYTLKLLAISKQTDGKIEARVHPSFILANHPLASVKGSFNALYIHGDSVDDVMLYGRGAGSLPTASAIVSDIVFASGKDVHRRYFWEDEVEVNDDDFATDFTTAYYVRIAVNGEDGSLAKVAKAFENGKIGVKNVLKKADEQGDYLVLVTEETKESNMKLTLDNVRQLSCVDDVCALLRVEN